MFVRIHFDAASLFSAMVIMTSIALRLNVYVALEDNIASCLNGLCIKMIKFSFEKNGICTKLDKKRIKRELKNIRKRKCQLFLEIGCNVLEIMR